MWLEPGERVDVQRLVLEKARVAAMQELGPQIAHDLEADVLTDAISDNLIYRIQTEVMSYRDGEDEQVVWSEVEVKELPSRPYVIAVGGALGAAAIFATAFAWLPGALVGFALAYLVLLAYLCWTPPKRRVRKRFRVKATKWLRFPENTMVFPKELRDPVVQIMTDYPYDPYEVPNEEV